MLIQLSCKFITSYTAATTIQPLLQANNSCWLWYWVSRRMPNTIHLYSSNAHSKNNFHLSTQKWSLKFLRGNRSLFFIDTQNTSNGMKTEWFKLWINHIFGNMLICISFLCYEVLLTKTVFSKILGNHIVLFYQSLKWKNHLLIKNHHSKYSIQ